MTQVKIQKVFSTGFSKYFPPKKFLHTSFTYKFKEVSIRVPWGHISGKWWGPTDCKPILCLHGFRDNCGSFDKLIPFLSDGKHISFLAIDLPGHGFSSKIPQGMFYSFLNYTILVQQIYDYFKWSRLSLLGHSLGSMISFVSTILYPEKVDFVVCIDALGPLKTRVSKESVRKSTDDFIKYSKFIGEPPSYTWNEILQIMTTAYKQSMNLNSIKCLLDRSIAPSKTFPGKYFFTNDPRLKVRTMFNWEQEQILQDVATIDNPFFICEAKQDSYLKYRKSFHEIVNALRKHSRDCEFHSIDGTHHLHLEEPEKIGILIRNFLNKHYTVENSNLEDHTIFSQPVSSVVQNQKVD